MRKKDLTNMKRENMEKLVMQKIVSEGIKIKPKWFFLLGSLVSIGGLIGLGIVSVFLVNLILFLLRSHGPMGEFRLEQMLESFPLWIPVAAVILTLGGILILKKYDFSYKKNFPLIILLIISAILIAGFLIDRTGVNENWSRRGFMRRFYANSEGRSDIQEKQHYRRVEGKRSWQ